MQMTNLKLLSANLSKYFTSKLYHIENLKIRGQTVDLDEVAHYEPPRQDICCLRIHIFSPVVFKEVSHIKMILFVKMVEKHRWYIIHFNCS